MMDAGNIVTSVMAGLALLASVVTFALNRRTQSDRDAFERRSIDEAAEMQRRFLEIEEARHSWERAEREAAEEEHASARFTIRFGYRDSGHTWGRVIATNYGPSDAREVRLSVHAETDREVMMVRGEGRGAADRLGPNESVHVGVAFSLGSAQEDDLRYLLTWVDGRGDQRLEGRPPAS